MTITQGPKTAGMGVPRGPKAASVPTVNRLGKVKETALKRVVFAFT